jgi:hypothetical protein
MSRPQALPAFCARGLQLGAGCTVRHLRARRPWRPKSLRKRGRRTRGRPPEPQGLEVDLNTSDTFSDMNINKMSLCLNVRAEGLAIAKKLIAHI